MRWAIGLRRGRRESAESAECEPIARWDRTSHVRSASLDPGDHPGEGEGDFLSGIHPEERIREIGAHRSAIGEEAVAPSLAKQTIHTVATLFSLRKATEGLLWASNLYIYRKILIIYGRGRALWACRRVWGVVPVWPRTPAQFGNPVFNMAARCCQ